MASKQAQAINQATAQVPAQDGNADEAAAVRAAAEAKAKERNAVLESVTFSEAFHIAHRSARWNDVLGAASAFAPFVEQASKSASDGKPTAIARKAASVAPREAMELRFSLASYSLSGRTANATQLAELAGKLPQLATKGSLRDRAVTFGGIVLPPIAGELS
jgi:hypothetical protein